MLRHRLNVSLLIASFATYGFTQAVVPTRTPTIDQSLEMYNVSSPKISPDGKHVIYEQSRTNWEANAFETDLWIADTSSGESHRLTMPVGSSNGAAWSPDGKWIAFLSGRRAPLPGSPEGQAQLYVLPLDGGEAQQITKLEKGVEAFAWAPDGKHIAISATSSETKAMKDRKESFGEYHVFHADYEMAHLWLVDVPAPDKAGRIATVPEPKLLTQGEAFSVGDFSFSPDGTKIAFAATRDPLATSLTPVVKPPKP